MSSAFQMHHFTLLLTVMLAIPQSPLHAQTPRPMNAAPLAYPPAARVDQVDVLHGQSIADPYRWLEDLDSSATAAWVAAENRVTQQYLAAIPQREKIRARLTELWNYQRYSLPAKRGNRYFFTKNDGLSNQSILHVSEGLKGEPRVLLDPNRLSDDGTIALTGWSVSDDGRKLAYGLATAGSDWNEWKVLDVDSGRVAGDHLKWVKFSGASWAHDHSGFYYSRFAEPPPGQAYTGTNFFQKLYFHRLGDPQEKDELIYERSDEKQWTFGGQATDDGRYLVISVSKGSEPKNQIFYKDLSQPQAKVAELITGFDADYDFVDNDGPVFWFVTDQAAPQRKLIAVDIRSPDRSGWRVLIPESKDTLSGVSAVGEHFIARYMQDARSAIRIHDLTGKPIREISLPGLGTAAGFGGRRDDAETFFAFTSYIAPATIHRYDVSTGETNLFREPALAFKAADYESKQIFYTSRDGTRIPMTIVHRRGLPLDGNRPTLLYGYGGFNIPLLPVFSVPNLVWMERGGVLAVPNLRGGGEYGSAWHEAGMRLQKQNVFDDFIAAASWLIENRYTRPGKLAIRGGSNGGLLVGAVMTQRPDLIRAAVPQVGVMDMLRYHKFTIGWAWATEYGSADEPDQFPNLLRYSPLHNLRAGTEYPATLIVTGERDDRVVPAHSFKFAAALQAAHVGERPVLIRIETRTGHGAGKPTMKLIEEAADILAFLARELGMDE